MGYWDENEITNPRLERLGPIFDAIVGAGDYAKAYATLNAAIAAGKKYIALTPGATMDADLTISVDKTAIWAPRGYAQTINASQYKITVSASLCYFHGFALVGTTSGDGITVSGNYNVFEQVGSSSWSNGKGFNISGDHNRFSVCHVINNGSDGFYFATGADYNMIWGCVINGNTGYGINNSGSGANTEGLNKILNNTAGALNNMTLVNGASIVP